MNPPVKPFLLPKSCNILSSHYSYIIYILAIVFTPQEILQGQEYRKEVAGKEAKNMFY